MAVNFNKAEFILSATEPRQFVRDGLPQMAFAGRSNVGKSSCINRLLNRKNFARVGASPGKTTQINYFKIDSKLYLVDLPGYGYAKVADRDRERWAELMEGYFRTDRNIKLCLQLIDMRHPATEFDISMLQFLSHFEIPYAVVLTKCDKLNKTEFTNRLDSLKDELGELGDGVTIIPFSALKGTGADEVRKAVELAVSEN